MASPSCNIHFDHLQIPDASGWTMRDFNCSQFAPLAYQSSTSILVEPSITSADPLLYTHHIQYPIAPIASSYAISSASPSTCSDLCCINQNAIRQSLIDNDCAATGPATGYLGPSHGTGCTNLPASASSVQGASQVKAISDSYTKGKRAYGRNQGRQQKQE